VQGASGSGALVLAELQELVENTALVFAPSSSPELVRLRCALCREINFTERRMEDGRLLSSAKAHLAGDAHKREVEKGARSQLLEKFVKPVPRPPPYVPDLQKLCWGLHAETIVFGGSE
jgi:hypothetical protein